MSNSPTPVFQKEFSEQGGKVPSMLNSNSDLLNPPENHNSLKGPVAILWDIENCPVPSLMRPEDVSGNIRMILRDHPIIDGNVTVFSAYGDFNIFSRRVREGCQRTGVKLIDVPNGRKDAADKAILVDMFLFALDNPPPSSIMLISGDVDFAAALHILGQRGYTIILAIPSRVGVSSALINAGRFVWDWPSLARGVGCVPHSKTLSTHRPVLSGISSGGEIINRAYQNEEESIVYKGISNSCFNARNISVPSRLVSDYINSSMAMPPSLTSSQAPFLPTGLNHDVTGSLTCDGQNKLNWVQPGLRGLKRQLVKLLELAGGSLLLCRLPAEYHKKYGKPLFISEYGSIRLENLLKKMSDAILIEERGPAKFVYNRNSKTGPGSTFHPVILARSDKKGKGYLEEGGNDVIPETGTGTGTGAGTSEEISDNERVVIIENEENWERQKSKKEKTECSEIISQSLEKFKFELQEILVSFSCHICLCYFDAIYQQRYKRSLSYLDFGVSNLEELLEKMKDVVEVFEEPVSKRKFMVAISS